MGDFLQIGKMAVEKSGSNGEEIGVTRVVDLNNTPGILTSSDFATSNLDDLLRANDSKRHEASELSVLLNGILVVLLNIVREVVDRDSVVLDILHDELLRLSEFGGGERIGAANDGNNVNTRSKALHQFDIEFTKTVQTVSR